jgi:hypothetical protein
VILYAYATKDWKGIPSDTYYRTRKAAKTDSCANSSGFQLVAFRVHRIGKVDATRTASSSRKIPEKP